MTDWKAVATAFDRHIPAPDLERIAPALNTLENAFRPLLPLLSEDIEPAVMFDSEEGEA